MRRLAGSARAGLTATPERREAEHSCDRETPPLRDHQQARQIIAIRCDQSRNQMGSGHDSEGAASDGCVLHRLHNNRSGRVSASTAY
jgi:hypothetical protein